MCAVRCWMWWCVLGCVVALSRCGVLVVSLIGLLVRCRCVSVVVVIDCWSCRLRIRVVTLTGMLLVFTCVVLFISLVSLRAVMLR